MSLPSRQPPTADYNGTTIILDRPSRFDRENNSLLSGIARHWVDDFCGLKVDACEVRLASERGALMPGTKRLVLAGNEAIKIWTNGRHSLADQGYTILVEHQARPYDAIGVFNFQDCMDFQSVDSDDDDDDETFSERDMKDGTATRRSNYPFWTAWGCRKLLGLTPRADGGEFKVVMMPNLTSTIKLLRETIGQTLYFDIECSRTFGTLDCVGFRINYGTTYVVPIYNYDNKRSYGLVAQFLHAFSLALRRNLCVHHNGSGFDLPYLASFYRIGFGRDQYDTMLANHRLFTEPEKSLGHVIGQWTDFPYHKDQIITPHNHAQDERYWMYNAQDVHRLAAIRDAQLQYASQWPGALESIAQVQRCVYPYVCMTLKGIRMDPERLKNEDANLARRMRALQRIGTYLVGRPFNLNSSPAAVAFFHDELGYEPVSKSEKTGAPSLGKKALYKLGVKYDNPLIPLIIHYRKTAKDYAMVTFTELKPR